jgi:hypothetical protein
MHYSFREKSSIGGGLPLANTVQDCIPMEVLACFAAAADMDGDTACCSLSPEDLRDSRFCAHVLPEAQPPAQLHGR